MKLTKNEIENLEDWLEYEHRMTSCFFFKKNCEWCKEVFKYRPEHGYICPPRNYSKKVVEHKIREYLK